MEFKVASLLPEMTEKEYRAEKMASYSSLSKLSNNDFSIFQDTENKFTKGLSLGSVVDKMIFEPDFDVYKEYNIVEYIPDFNNGNAIDDIIIHIKENDLEYDKNSIDKVNDLSKTLRLWGNIKNDELRVKRIDIDKFWDGLNYIKLSKNNKPFLLSADLQIAFKMVDVLRTYKYTKDIFVQSDKFEYIFQAKILFEVNGHPIKSMLDIIIVDHVRKIIYPKDLKTGQDKNFYQNFNRFHYPMQSSTYSLAVRALVDNNKELEGYEVAPFEFIYISRESINTPRIYEMHELYTEMGIQGWTSTTGIRYKGIIELLKDYNWHIENQVFDISRDQYRNKGRISIKNPFDAGAAERELERLMRAARGRRPERIPAEQQAVDRVNEVVRATPRFLDLGNNEDAHEENNEEVPDIDF